MNEQVQEIRYLVGEAWKGTYNGATTYGNANVVQDPTGLSVYRSLKPGNVGHALTDTAWWFCIIDLSSIKAESDRIAALNTAIAQDEQLRVAAEQQREQAEQSRVDAEAGRVSAEAQRVQAESNRVSAENSRVLAEQGRVSAESARVQAESNRVSAEASRVLAEQGRVSAENQRAVNEENRQAVFAEDHRIAVADHQTAEADHTTAVADHETAVQDNAQMTVLVNRADADHVQAGQDHTRAESDHTTAAADHTQAGTDHQTAAADHQTAGADHTQSGNDHTRAESDHTRAESDHAAVEVYVDSLGAFDISAYHATGGVLAKYADLTAALGTNGANIPDALRKGGMSVKFVLSSDNKYVQYMCKSSTWSSTPTDWEKINNADEIEIIDAKVISLFSTADKSTYLKEGYAIQEDGQLSQVGGSWKAYYKIPIFAYSILDAVNLHPANISSPYASLVLYDKSGVVIEVYHDKSPLKNYVIEQDGFVSITFTSSGTGIKIQNLNVPINAKYANGVIDKSYTSLDYSKYKKENYALINDGSMSGASGWNTFHRIPIHKGDVVSLTNLLPSSNISSPYASCVIYDTSFNIISAFIGNTPLKDYICEEDGFISFMYRSGVTYDGKIERIIDYVSLDITPYFSANRVLLKEGGVDTINGWNSYIKIPIKKGMRIYAQNLSGSNLSGPYATILIYKNDEDTLSYYQNINPLNGYLVEEDGFISVCTNSGLANIDIEVPIIEAITSLTNKVTENSVFNCLPQNIDCPVSRNTDIFLDAVSYPINKKCIVGSTSELIRRGNNIIRYAPTTSNTIVARFQIVDDNKKRLSISSVNFRGVPRNNGTGETKSVMIIGDSLIDGTFTAPECFRLLEEDNDFNIIQIGTRTAVMDNITYYEEGRSGWGWAAYINPDYETTPYFDRTNAFMHNGVLDFSHYMETNFPDVSTLDYVIIALGTNDCGQGALLLTWTDINRIIDNAKTFIDALLSDYPNCKIAIGMPSVGAPTFPAGNRIAEDFVISMQMLNKAYVDTFDNGKYNLNVTCVAHGLYLDRINSYLYVDAPNNDYVDMSGNALEYVLTHTRSYIDQVHPALIGYKQWGRGLYGKVRAFLNGLL